MSRLKWKLRLKIDRVRFLGSTKLNLRLKPSGTVKALMWHFSKFKCRYIRRVYKCFQGHNFNKIITSLFIG
jgi:hypothetical protein